jgi:hypothetical protein
MALVGGSAPGGGGDKGGCGDKGDALPEVGGLVGRFRKSLEKDARKRDQYTDPEPAWKKKMVSVPLGYLMSLTEAARAVILRLLIVVFVSSMWVPLSVFVGRPRHFR